jgi:hypothetical protein
VNHPDELTGALTIFQPWASAIIDGHKDVENRGWPFPYPAPAAIAVHAGREAATPAQLLELWPGSRTHPQPDRDTVRALPRGAYLGTVVVTGSHPADDCATPSGRRCSRWAYRFSGGHHWTLTDPRPLPLPLPAAGRLRVFQPGPVHRAILETVCLKGHCP